MCWCTPEMRTPFCGKPGCHPPQWPLAPIPGDQPPRVFDYPVTGHFPYRRQDLISEREMDGNAPGERDPQTGALNNQPERMLRLFAYAHFREDLQGVSKPFSDLAQLIALTVPRGPERTVALRKLLEAKDATVRAVVFPD